ERALANRADTLQGSNRITEVEQEASEIDELELAEPFHVEVVHAQFHVPHLGLQHAMSHAEADAFALSRGELLDHLGGAVDRPIPCHRVDKVDGNNLGGSSLLHLECPEAVECPDVKASLSGE